MSNARKDACRIVGLFLFLVGMLYITVRWAPKTELPKDYVYTPIPYH